MNITAEKFQEAIEFAASAHKGAYRKGDGRPYILHPMSVVGRLYAVKESKNMFLLGTAAILHDTMEDVEEITLKTIISKFGVQVAALVQELTLDKSQYETIGKTEYLSRELLKMSSYALTIKLCDRWDNVCDLATMEPDFVRRYVRETNDMLRRLVLGRKLTDTHKKLVNEIMTELKKYREHFNTVDHAVSSDISI